MKPQVLVKFSEEANDRSVALSNCALSLIEMITVTMSPTRDTVWSV